jgi:hypothetical protein
MTRETKMTRNLRLAIDACVGTKEVGHKVCGRSNKVVPANLFWNRSKFEKKRCFAASSSTRETQ